MVELTASNVKSKISEALTKLEVPVGAAGFVTAVVENDVKFAMESGNWDSMSLEDKAKFITKSVSIRTTGLDPFPGELSSGWQRKFNAFGFLNKYALLLALIDINSAVDGIYPSIVKKIRPFAVGGTIGGIFDPPASSTKSARSSGAAGSAANPVW